jgi:pimeloyl-ACP methyl ester carboxylesterase
MQMLEAARMTPEPNPSPSPAGTGLTRRSLGGLAVAAAALTGLARNAHAAPAAATRTVAAPWTGEGFVQRAGGKLHYVTMGEGTPGTLPVVLLHKLGGWVADWRGVAPHLAKTRRVIAFDLPGHGDSKWLGDAPYIQSLAETAALLVAALDQIGVQRFDLVGTSLGGCIAGPLAALFPDQVRKLALLSCALGTGISREDIHTKIDIGEASRSVNGVPNPVTPELIRDVFGIIHADQIAAEETQSDYAGGLWLQPSERGVAVTNIVGYLKRVQAPTLLVYGDHSKAYNKYRPAAEAALKDVRVEIVPDAGDFTLQDNPPATAQVLLRFLG